MWHRFGDPPTATAMFRIQQTQAGLGRLNTIEQLKNAFGVYCLCNENIAALTIDYSNSQNYRRHSKTISLFFCNYLNVSILVPGALPTFQRCHWWRQTPHIKQTPWPWSNYVKLHIKLRERLAEHGETPGNQAAALPLDSSIGTYGTELG